MGQKVTFDPINKIIQVHIAPVSGEIGLDVKVDLYSDMKEDWEADPSLFKYRLPITSVGGNPLPGSKALGSTFFLQPPWKIRPYEADHRFLVNGNLYSTDGTSPYTTTVGTFNVIIESSVSSLVDSTVQQLAEIEYGSFEGGVWVDENSLISGTGGLNGNAQNPVNNIPDAVAICLLRGLPQTIFVIGNYTFDTGDDISKFKVIGQNASRSTFTINTLADTAETEFNEAYVVGTLDGNSIIRNCMVSGLSYVSGVVFSSLINPGTISLGGTGVAFFLDCYSGVPGLSTPTLDCNGLSNLQTTSLAIRNYNGGIKIIDFASGAKASLDFGSGQCIIDMQSCTDGTIVIRGDASVKDENGAHLATGQYGNLSIVNECISGAHLHEIWARLGLDIDKPLITNEDGSITVGNITITATTTGIPPNRQTTQTRQ